MTECDSWAPVCDILFGFDVLCYVMLCCLTAGGASYLRKEPVATHMVENMQNVANVTRSCNGTNMLLVLEETAGSYGMS